MHDILDVAKWFTNKNGGTISLRKMQTLCYYAQAWSYALRNKTLFAGYFQAWAHGPVNRKLWNKFKYIEYRDITIADFPDCLLETTPFSLEENFFLERVWATYGHLTGYQLEEIARSETPWIEKRNRLGLYGDSRIIINTQTMNKYYKKLYKLGRRNLDENY